MAAFKTPGVYVQEISTLPPSVAEVSTAVPAFLGYTEKGAGRVERINTLLDFEELFGGPLLSSLDVTVTDGVVGDVVRGYTGTTPAFIMYHCMRHYFANGGGTCWAISVGEFPGTPADPASMDKNDFLAGLGELEKVDEPTLIYLTDAVNLSNVNDYYDLVQTALDQCNKLKDRFTIIDVPDGAGDVLDDATDFRNGNVSNYLMYGAAYTPYLNTTFAHPYEDGDVDVHVGVTPAAKWEFVHEPSAGTGVVIQQIGAASAPTFKVELVPGSPTDITFSVTAGKLTINIPDITTTGLEVESAWETYDDGVNPVHGFDIFTDTTNSGSGNMATKLETQLGFVTQSPVVTDTTLDLLLNPVPPNAPNTALYNDIKKALNDPAVLPRAVLPPGAAMAGIYARVDRDRGVWKAPANVGVSSVSGPHDMITHEDQEVLNIDVVAGKSINAIRAFAGKGTLVWGARTLAGNDNEWRYVPVRRLFIMIEESTKKASSFAVFEPNDATTWLKVKGMIEAFLLGLWERGALQGATPESAYFVNVGLGKTMTTQDILEGRMNVEIGIAAVRPAEFIILKFSHKLAEA